jgi:hypothetical protein
VQRRVCSLAEDASGEGNSVDEAAREGLSWRRSSHCSDSTCVEVAWSGDDVLMRDAKDPAGPLLRFSRKEWAHFVSAMGRGESGLSLELDQKLE